MTVPAAIVQGAQACKGVLRHRITKAVLAAVIVYLTVSSISFSQVKQSFLDTDASYFAPFIVVSVATQTANRRRCTDTLPSDAALPTDLDLAGDVHSGPDG